MADIRKFILGHKEWVIILSCVFIFLLLLFKDPFSERTLIPNFEPYPDTFFYIVAPLNLIKGEGFYLSREGRKQKSSIPPLYSLTFLPFFAIFPDPRMAYFANVLLALISATLFFLILKRITENVWIIGLTFFLYVTNHFLYWVPTLAMAENLLLPLFLWAILLLISKNNSLLSFLLLGVVSLCIYATKFASVPVGVSIIIFSIIKIISQDEKKIWKFKAFLFLCFGFASLFTLYALYLYFVSKYNIFSSLLGYLGLVSQVIGSPNAREISSSGWVSFNYIKVNLPLYLSSLFGNSERFLWDFTPIIPKYVAIISLAGILMGLATKYRFISLTLIAMVGGSILFLLTFYSFDARYIYVAIPSLLIGFSIFTSILFNLFSKTKFLLLIKIGLLIFFIFYVLTNFIRIKSQISLNLRYAETPWYYVSVLKLNEYFSKDKIINDKKPIVISALPPFLVDFYSNGNYTLLPLSYDQEFRSAKEIVWGPNDYSDLLKLYTKYLRDGYDLYLSRYGLGNEGYTNRDFNNIVKEFDTKLVFPGCFEQCNIYKVKLKN